MSPVVDVRLLVASLAASSHDVKDFGRDEASVANYLRTQAD